VERSSPRGEGGKKSTGGASVREGGKSRGGKQGILGEAKGGQGEGEKNLENFVGK